MPDKLSLAGFYAARANQSQIYQDFKRSRVKCARRSKTTRFQDTHLTKDCHGPRRSKKAYLPHRQNRVNGKKPASQKKKPFTAEAQRELKFNKTYRGSGLGNRELLSVGKLFSAMKSS